MYIEDHRSATLQEAQKLQKTQEFISHQRASFTQEMADKENQLKLLVDKKQAELEHYELCLRKEAMTLATKEEQLDAQQSQNQ